MSAPPLRPDMAQTPECDDHRPPMTLFDRIIWIVIAVFCAGSAIGWFMLAREILP